MKILISGARQIVTVSKRALILTLILILSEIVVMPQSQHLKRSADAISEVKMDFSTTTAHYRPFFGRGDDSSGIVTGVERFGQLTIDPKGSSDLISIADEEQIFFVLEGTGTLQHGTDLTPVSGNDFIYIPAGTLSRFSNPRERPLTVLIMGFMIQPENEIKPSANVMIANADDVPSQVLGSHGPTTKFQLLLGTTESTRDRLAAACQVTSLFIMDFAAGGTNIPHRHDKEEEIYYILRGRGDIVAGETNEGKESRHPSQQGDAYFFSPRTLIGFYSGNKTDEEHARILAVRFNYPLKK